MSFGKAGICWKGYRKNESLNHVCKLETIKIPVFALKKIKGNKYVSYTLGENIHNKYF